MTLTDPAKAMLAVNRIARSLTVEFNPVSGETYYLYEREDKSFFISLVAPEYWSTRSPVLTFISDLEFTQSGGWKFKKRVSRCLRT